MEANGVSYIFCEWHAGARWVGCFLSPLHFKLILLYVIG